MIGDHLQNIEPLLHQHSLARSQQWLFSSWQDFSGAVLGETCVEEDWEWQGSFLDQWRAKLRLNGFSGYEAILHQTPASRFEAMVVERKAKKPKVSVKDLAKEWDQCDSIREYLRDNPKEPLFHENINVCVADAAKPYIFSILEKTLLRSAGVPTQPQPPVGPLRGQLDLLYKKVSREPIESEVIKDSWYIRKLFSLVKNKAKKSLVSTAPHLKFENKQICMFEFRQVWQISWHKLHWLSQLRSGISRSFVASSTQPSRTEGPFQCQDVSTCR